MSSCKLWNKYRNSLSRVLTKGAKDRIVDLFDKKRITMIGKSGMRNEDGTSEVRIVGKKKKYRIEIKNLY